MIGFPLPKAVGLWAFFLLLAACSQPEVKPTEDLHRIDQIDALLSDLRDSLQRKDSTSLSRFFPPERQADYSALTKMIPSLETPKLDLYIDRILLEEDTATVTLHWEFRWSQTLKGGEEPKEQKHRGNAIFLFKGSPDYLWVTIEGDNPLLAPLIASKGEKVLSK